MIMRVYAVHHVLKSGSERIPELQKDGIPESEWTKATKLCNFPVIPAL